MQSNPDITPAQQRWADDQAALDRLDPWRDTKNVVMQKDPRTGVVTARPRGDGQRNGAPGTGDQPQTTPAGPASGKLVVGDQATNKPSGTKMIAVWTLSHVRIHLIWLLLIFFGIALSEPSRRPAEPSAQPATWPQRCPRRRALRW